MRDSDWIKLESENIQRFVTGNKALKYKLGNFLKVLSLLILESSIRGSGHSWWALWGWWAFSR